MPIKVRSGKYSGNKDYTQFGLVTWSIKVYYDWLNVITAWFRFMALCHQKLGFLYKKRGKKFWE